MYTVTFINVFLLVTSYIVLNNVLNFKKINMSVQKVSNGDNVYKIIPKTKANDPNDLIRLCLAVAPMLYLLKKSNTSKPIEHLTVLMSFILTVKSMKRLTNTDTDNNLLFSYVIASCISLVFWKIIDYKDVNLIYLYITLFAIFELSRRNINSSQIINDLILVHSVFFFTK